MATYTKLSPDEIESITREFDVGAVLNSEPIDGGASNSNSTVDTNIGKFVLSVCDAKSPEEAGRLVKLLSHLASTGFPTSKTVIPSNNGGFVMYGGKPIILRTFVPGEVHRELDQGMLQDVGERMAYLHSIPAPDYLPGIHGQMAGLLSDVNQADLPPGYAGWLREKREAIRKHMPQLQRLEKSLIHGDVFYDNLLFDEGGLTSMIDFESACHYYRIFDLASCIIGSCMDDTQLVLQRGRELVRGYQRGGEIDEQEQRLLQQLVVSAAAASSFWNFEQHNRRYPDPHRADEYMQRVEVADEIQAIPADRFVKTLFS